MSKLPEAIWVVKPRSHTKHVIAEKRFMPALCGMTPGTWFTVSQNWAQGAYDKYGETNNGICAKCLAELRAQQKKDDEL